MKWNFFERPLLMYSFLLALILSAAESPGWVVIFAVVMILWRLLYEKWRLPKIPRIFTGVLAAVLVLQIYLQYRTLFGQESSNAMLVALSALKIMDYEEERDHLFIVLLGFIILSIKAVFTIDVYWAIPSMVSFMGLWASLMRGQTRYKFLVGLVIASLPLTLILFVAFPRVVVPWALNRTQSLSRVGFSDSISPGGVAELASHNFLAFRTQFSKGQPKVSELYWRGAVLTESRGMEWTGSSFRSLVRQPQGEADLIYQVILEPGSKGFLFTLASPLKVIGEDLEINVTEGEVYRSFSRPNSSLNYKVWSRTSLRDQSLPNSKHRQFPRLGTQSHRWVEEVKSQYTTDEERLRQLDLFFKNPRFTYTLNPGTYSNNGMDEFLFERRRGFCEHFAGSYATLARALGLASRVVVGYQGGSFNSYGRFWRVSQQDAHAWVEIFLDGYWQSKDPTELVAPSRVEFGALAFFNLPEESRRDRSAFEQIRQGAGLGVFEKLSLWTESINYRWSTFLLEYDLEEQKSWMAKIYQSLIQWILGLMLVLGMAYFLMRWMMAKGPQRKPVDLLLDQVVIWGAHQGQPMLKGQTPLNYLETLKNSFPQRSELIAQIQNIYDQSVYAEREAINVTGLLHEWGKADIE